MNKTLFAPVAALLVTISVNAGAECRQLAVVKYRPSLVCLDTMDYGNTNKSSWVRGAWYNSQADYMVINLQGTLYHYCRVPSEIWKGLISASSHGTYYNANIKGRFDCRLGGVPQN
jgi:hypothetical protein